MVWTSVTHPLTYFYGMVRSVGFRFGEVWLGEVWYGVVWISVTHAVIFSIVVCGWVKRVVWIEKIA